MRQHARAHALRGLLILTPLLALAACGPGELAGGVPESAFVSAMAALERIERDPALDSAARVAARARVLQGQGLTRAQLEAAAASLADDPERALELFREIERRVSGADSVAASAVDTGVTAPKRR